MREASLGASGRERTGDPGGRGQRSISPDRLLCKTVKTQGRLLDPETLAISFVISTPDIDREGDRLALEGWDLENYRRNPVVLWAHDQTRPPVARAREIAVSAGALTAVAEFTPRDVNPFGFMTFQLYAAGFLNAVSVGFLPRVWHWAGQSDPGEAEMRAGGIDFERQELVEFSCVPIPANPRALMAARVKGIDVLPLARWAESHLDRSAEETLPRAFLESLRHAALGSRSRLSAIEPAESADGSEGEEANGPQSCERCENPEVCIAATACYLANQPGAPPGPMDVAPLDPPQELEIEPDGVAEVELPPPDELQELVVEAVAAALAPLGLAGTQGRNEAQGSLGSRSRA